MTPLGVVIADAKRRTVGPIRRIALDMLAVDPEEAATLAPPGEDAPDSLRRTALLLDYPLLVRVARAQQPDAVPDLSRILARACAYGPLYTARAYGAWFDADEARTAFSVGVDPVFVPPARAGAAPTTTALVADGLQLVQTGLAEALVVGGDERLLPLIAAARRAEIPVVLLAHLMPPGGPCTRLATAVDAPATAFVRQLSRAEKYRRPQPSAQRTA